MKVICTIPTAPLALAIARAASRKVSPITRKGVVFRDKKKYSRKNKYTNSRYE